jgi:hypothetical protein
VTSGVIATADQTTTTPTQYSGDYTVPNDGTVSYLRVYIGFNGTPGSGEGARFDDVTLTLVPGALQNVAGNTAINENGVAITNGALSVQNAGGTVIIDGSSDMFKIAATGTMNMAAQGGAGQVTTDITLATGITYNPASSAYLNTAYAYQMPYFVDNGAGALLDWYSMGASVVSTNHTKVHGEKNTLRGGGLGAISYKYYVFSEAAL